MYVQLELDNRAGLQSWSAELKLPGGEVLRTGYFPSLSAARLWSHRELASYRRQYSVGNLRVVEVSPGVELLTLY